MNFMRAKSILTVLILLSLPTFSGCFLQPKTETVTRWNMITVEDAPAYRVAKPIKASFFDWAMNREVEVELIEKNESGEWVSIGKGNLPAGAWIRGQKPKLIEPTK